MVGVWKIPSCLLGNKLIDVKEHIARAMEPTLGKAIKMIPIEHPGVMLKEDFLDDLGVKPGSFAHAIKKIIDGKRAITADMSLRFGLFFNISAGFWLNLQKDYELRVAKRDKLAELEIIVERFG